jgi:hypothetical protein
MPLSSRKVQVNQQALLVCHLDYARAALDLAVLLSTVPSPYDHTVVDGLDEIGLHGPTASA